jgi:hypothetical protein
MLSFSEFQVPCLWKSDLTEFLFTLAVTVEEAPRGYLVLLLRNKFLFLGIDCSETNLWKYILGRGQVAQLPGFPLLWLLWFCLVLFEELLEILGNKPLPQHHNITSFSDTPSARFSQTLNWLQVPCTPPSNLWLSHFTNSVWAPTVCKITRWAPEILNSARQTYAMASWDPLSDREVGFQQRIAKITVW